MDQPNYILKSEISIETDREFRETFLMSVKSKNPEMTKAKKSMKDPLKVDPTILGAICQIPLKKCTPTETKETKQ